MSAIYQPLCVLHRSPSAASPGSNPGRSAGAELPDPLVGLLEIDPAGGTLLLARLAALGHDVQVVQVVLVPTGGGVTAAEPAFMSAALGESSWTVTTNDGATFRVANTSPCILERTLTRTAGALLVTEPMPSLVLDGSTLALFVTPPTGYSARVWVRPRNWDAATTTQHGAYRDPLTTTLAQLLDVQRGYLATRSGAAWQVQPSQLGALPLPSSSAAASSAGWAIDCVFASSGPLGAVWVDSSDVGVSTPTKTQIPTNLSENSPEAFNRYPSSFYRRPGFGRGVLVAGEQLGTRDTDSITTVAGVPTIYVTDVDLAASEWLVQIDGVAVRLVLSHEGLSGIRRPLDVWNRLIVPAIQANRYLANWSGVEVVGQIDRLEWLEYARFLGGWRTLDLTVRAYSPFGQVGMPAAP